CDDTVLVGDFGDREAFPRELDSFDLYLDDLARGVQFLNGRRQLQARGVQRGVDCVRRLLLACGRGGSLCGDPWCREQRHLDRDASLETAVVAIPELAHAILLILEAAREGNDGLEIRAGKLSHLHRALTLGGE